MEITSFFAELIELVKSLPDTSNGLIALILALPLTLRRRKKSVKRKRALARSKQARDRNHAWRRKHAARVLRQLWKGQSIPPDVFARIRAMDPLAFEELVLSAIARHGYKIERGESYSGDGGVDGKAVIGGKKFILQMKRYQGHINARHVSEFGKVCHRYNKKGLFIHTGKTGKLAMRRITDGPIGLISGDKLFKLLTGGDLDFAPFNDEEISYRQPVSV